MSDPMFADIMASMPCLQANLDVLRNTAPDLAGMVDSAPILPGFQRGAGTDGTPTYCRNITDPASDKSLEWLGATSMPRASATPLCASLDAHAGGANGLGLSIGTGFEWLAFLQRLSWAQALYVYEPEPALLRMALDTCDLAAPLASRRLVLLTSDPDAAADCLITFLREHLGFEPPRVLHPLPTLIGQRCHQLLAAGETIVRRAVADHQSQLAGLLNSLHTAAPPAGPPHPVAFLLSPRRDSDQPLAEEARRRRAAITRIDRYECAGFALRCRQLIDLVAQGRCPLILSDLMRPQLGALPDWIPVETWIPPVVGSEFWQRLPSPRHLAPADRIVVHGGYIAHRLQSLGFPAPAIHLAPLGPRCTGPRFSSPPALRHRVALIGDLPATSPAALGLELPSHQAVRDAAADLIAADYLTVHPAMAPDLLHRALCRAGIDPTANSAAFAESMLRIIRDVLIPAIPPLTLTAHLARHGMDLLLVGAWPDLDRHVRQCDLPHITRCPGDDGDRDTWRHVALLAHLSPQGTVPPLLWHAMDAGVAIIAPRHPADDFAGSLPHLLSPDMEFACPAPSHFISTLASLLRNASRREALASAALRRATSSIAESGPPRLTDDVTA